VRGEGGRRGRGGREEEEEGGETASDFHFQDMNKENISLLFIGRGQVECHKSDGQVLLLQDGCFFAEEDFKTELKKVWREGKGRERGRGWEGADGRRWRVGGGRSGVS
jgi:hypothetical protein